jgi:hypothetical protein
MLPRGEYGVHTARGEAEAKLHERCQKALNQDCLKVEKLADQMAERVGFEPTVRFPVRSLSRRVLSTAQSPLRGGYNLNRSRRLHFSAIRLIPIGEDTTRASAPDQFLEKELCLLGSALSEKRLKDGSAIAGENTRSHFHLVI